MEKIIILIDDISRGAGTERAVTNLANILGASKSYHVIVCSLYSNHSSYFELISSVELIHLGLVRKSKSSYFKVLKEIRAFLKIELPKFVIGTTHAINSILPLSCLGLNIKLLGCEHMSYNAAPRISRLLRRMSYPFLSALVTLTSADSLFYSFMKSKVYVIPNSISYIPNQSSTLESKTIISIGRLTEQKGYDLLLEIIFSIKEELGDWQFKLFGEGELKEELLNKIESLGISDYIEILPTTKNIYKEYLNASMYVMTSRWEGLPMVLLEASSFGLPIVSFDCPEGPRDIVKDGWNGYLIPIFDINEFGNKILDICVNTEDRKILGQNSLCVSELFHPNEVLKKWICLFNNLK